MTRRKLRCKDASPDSPCLDSDKRVKGLCLRHYQQRRIQAMPPCEVAGCGRRSFSMGLCLTHYRWKKTNRPMGPVRRLRAPGAPPLICEKKRCGETVDRRGLCRRHYAMAFPCRVESCERGRRSNGLCEAHYQRGLNGVPLDEAPIGMLDIRRRIERLETELEGLYARYQGSQAD